MARHFFFFSVFFFLFCLFFNVLLNNYPHTLTWMFCCGQQETSRQEVRNRMQSSTNCLMEFRVSSIIKQLLSVIDLRRSVSQLCGIRKPNCSEVLHYSTGTLTWRLTRACQFLSGGLGIATLNHLPFLIVHSHVYTLTQKWFMLGHYHMKLHTHSKTTTFPSEKTLQIVVLHSDQSLSPLRV